MPQSNRTIRLLLIALLANAALLTLLAVAFVALTPPGQATQGDGAVTVASVTPTEQLERRYRKDVQPLLKTYCYDCHAGPGRGKGGVKLDNVDSLAAVTDKRKTWEGVVANLHEHVMPPEDEPQPTQNEREIMTAWVTDALYFCDCSGPHNPGRVTIRRLNRTEYHHTIRDLVSVDFKPAADFPADNMGYGFDNIADALSVSPLLTEKYLDAAEQIIHDATHYDRTGPRRSERFAGTKLKTGQSSSFVGNAVNLWTTDEAYTHYMFKQDGEYRFRIRARGQQAGPDPARVELRVNREKIKVFDTTAKSQAFEAVVKVKKGRRKIGAAFINDYYKADDPDPKNRDRNLFVEEIEIDGPLNVKPSPPPAAYRQVFFIAPSDGRSEDDCARKVIERFATRAFRRPATADETDRLVKLYRAVRDNGDSYEDAVRLALQAVLVSPHFLFRIEDDRAAKDVDANGYRTLNDYELASRLSYFLWSSMPDAELIEVAAAGRLQDTQVLRSQVLRMLADPKADALVENFTGQWLELRNLAEITPDPARYPQFDDALRLAMQREAELVLAHIMRNDRSLLELIDADYTFVNTRLAEHYGIKLDPGDRKPDSFEHVAVGDSGRGGVLTMAGVLTVTSNPTRTSPVKRGKWVLEQILGAPPPPPPPDVPELPEVPEEDQSASLRERFESHRSDPNCASCHVLMDPLGFSMERFDPIGRVREKDGKFAIDDHAQLPDGTAFVGAPGLKKLLIKGRRDQFVNCFTEKMLTYALGRGLEYYDRCAVKDIAKDLANREYRFGELIMAIVESEPFRKRNTRQDES